MGGGEMTVPNPDVSGGGTFRTLSRQYFGPSIGWSEIPAQLILPVTAAGTYALSPDVTSVTVNVAGAVVIVLPSAIQPSQGAVQPGLIGNLPITIVDIGGFAAAHPITIQPFSGAENIMGLNSITISVNYGAFSLMPNSTLKGWLSISP
jgi:hypothetical protein